MISNNIRSIRLGVLFIVLLVYLPTFGAYFQQDEWIAFGNALARGNFSLINLFSFSFAPNVGHYVPFHHIFFGILFQLFGLSFTKWMFVSILWHLAATYAVGLLLFKLLKNNVSATLGMLLFGLSGAAHQATTWVVADINTHGSTLFGILAILAFLHAMDVSHVTKRWLYVSVGLVITSLLFKETTIGLFATLPALSLLKDRKTPIHWMSVIKQSRLWIVYGAIYMFIRGFMFFLPSAQGTASVVTASQSIGKIVYNMLTFPAKAFSQSLIPFEIWLPLGEKIGMIPAKILGIELNTSRYELFVQSRLLEGTFVLIFVVVLLLTWFVNRRLSNYYTKLALLSLYFISVNSVIFAFSPERTGVITFIDSRNLYLILVGTILFIFSLFQLATAKRLKMLFTAAIITLILINMLVLVSTISSSVRIGAIRTSILNRVDAIIPTSDRVVIYVESDSTYYGLSDDKKVVPFQSGFGQTLLVYLHQRYQFPSNFYSNYFLWPIYSEGDIASGSYAFGYFNQYNSLVTVVKKGFPIDSVYALKWYDRTEAFVDITSETRKRLADTIENEN